MKILVGSTNPVKIESVREAFSCYFENIEVEGKDIKSGVSAQPINEETFLGAQNRAVNLKYLSEKENLNSDFFVGIEGGIIKLFNRWFAFGCMCIINKEGKISFGTSPHFELPEIVVEKLLNGKELGDVMDELTNQKNSKQKNGAIGFFTNGVMNRKELYVEGLKVAIIPFLHSEMFYK
ncbi:inosine/xanthosine triphosphatase [Rosettibacter firmus]|uniref:inosine/xanthosine triphosphatase n=1 Tax=Rosettibacter firmus TaxID=3111522 RepID=UPI00336C17A8